MMVRRILGLSIGVMAFVFMALPPVASWADQVQTTTGNNATGTPVLMYVVRGQDGIFYYTLKREGTLAVCPAGACGFIPVNSCTNNPFQLSADTNANGFVDGGSFKVVPGSLSGDSDPDVDVLNNNAGSVTNTTVWMTTRGNDGNIYENAFDQGCDGNFRAGTFSSQAAGFADTDGDGWPSSSSTGSSWTRVGD